MAGVCGLGRPAHVRARSLCGVRRAQVSLGPQGICTPFGPMPMGPAEGECAQVSQGPL